MQKKMGEDDPALLEEIGKAKLSLEEKYDALFNELKTEWNQWDKAVDGGTRRRPAEDPRQDAGCAEPQELYPQPGAGRE